MKKDLQDFVNNYFISINRLINISYVQDGKNYDFIVNSNEISGEKGLPNC